MSGFVAVLISLPMGRAWAAVVPNWRIFGLSLNPGPFTIKEHVLLTTMATWHMRRTPLLFNQWMLVMSTQMFGFSVGGILRRFLIQPPSTIWPTSLVTCALFNTVHSEGFSRRSPTNYVNMSVASSSITFDWAQTLFLGSPIATPWWAEADIAASIVFVIWFLTPVLHYTSIWYSHYMPVWSCRSFVNTSKMYNVSWIINTNASSNLTAYKEYSPLFLSCVV
ncbi:hypothetical protein OG21DRAFT_1484092 [Imleria badia]|nr:hypothetical protein OG21DRAFT_1484092 [Imleria badia]